MLKRVSIQNFKSLKDVTLDLQKVNLLIGPNNSGKTNFLKAIRFMNTFLYQEEKTVDSEFFYKKDNRLDISILLSFRDLTIADEESTNKIFENFHFKTIGEFQYLTPRNGKFDFGESQQLDDNILVNNDEDIKNLSWRYFTGFVAIYTVYPNRLRNAYPLLPNNSIIFEDASNIVAFLDTVRDKYPDNFNIIQDGLKLCVPEFTQIRFDTIEADEEAKKYYGDKTFKSIGLYNVNQKSTYWADELSEGTLYFLSLLCILYQPEPPKILLLEEPEKGIHPRRIREVMDFIFRLAEEKDVQIILTSHNEHVLDEFATRPEAVFVFDKDDEGATYVKNLQRDIIEPTDERNRELDLDPVDLTSNLSENWLYGLLGGVPAIP